MAADRASSVLPVPGSGSGSGLTPQGEIFLRSMPQEAGWFVTDRGLQFAHIGLGQSQLESTTSSALNQIQNWGAAQCIVAGLPAVYRTRELRAVNKDKDFPFSSHDNRHCLQNVGEYFDLGMGRRKVELEKRQHNSHDFLLWAHEAVPSSKAGFTIYQRSFAKDQNTKSPFCRRYPRHHSDKWCAGKLIAEKEKTCSQTSHLKNQNMFVEQSYHHEDPFFQS